MGNVKQSARRGIGSTIREAVRTGDATWLEVQAVLRGAGEFAVYVDTKWGFRVRLPPAYRRNLAPLLSDVLILSPWTKSCLRLVPGRVWSAYLDYLTKNGIERPLVNSVIEARSRKVEVKSGDRVCLPKELIHDTTLFTTEEVVLLPNEVWIEIWEKAKRETDLARDVESFGGAVAGLPRTAQS